MSAHVRVHGDGGPQRAGRGGTARGEAVERGAVAARELSSEHASVIGVPDAVLGERKVAKLERRAIVADRSGASAAAR